MSVIYAVRTTVGREENVLDKVAVIVEKNNLPILAMILPKEVKGYILVETENITALEDALKGVNHVRGIVRQPVNMEEIKHFLVAKPAKISLEAGDIVELVVIPYKGEKARITRVDKTKREVTVELVESAIPIPVTLPIESVRLVQHIAKEEPVVPQV